ncbi:MAG: radical SAM family heme chaperone HemW [Coraliomargaritaceae bacterium]
MQTGLYCHIPFCASTCDFCAFYHEKPKRSVLLDYLEGMECEFKQIPKGIRFDTIFWGGGTPTLLSAKDLKRLGESMLKEIGPDFKEWTIEMAPSTVKADKLKVLLDLGVTRFSMGIQSFNPDSLEKLGRLHNPKQVLAAWELIEASAVKETNIDMMFALPNQELDDWYEDLNKANDLGSTHLSTYCLTFEEDTALYVKLSEGKLKIDEERERAFYEKGWDLLNSFGLSQYEISNFARSESSRCFHNINTWKMYDWIGCGPSAASQFNGHRYRNPSSIEKWLEGLKASDLNKEDLVVLSEDLLFTDSLIFGLRMNEGVDFNELLNRFSIGRKINTKPFLKLMNRFKAEGYLTKKDSHFILTREGQLKCDGIGSELLDLHTSD